MDSLNSESLGSAGSIVDFYEISGARNLDSENPGDRTLIYLNKPADFFLDMGEYNAFNRLRKDHLERLDVKRDQIYTIDYYDYKKWKRDDDKLK